MKKPIIIIALIILIAAGSVGALYVTGNLNKIIGKIFNRSEVLDMSDEKNFDEILKRVKDNLDEVKSVHAEVKGSSWEKIGDYDPSSEEGKGEIDFVFPDKKLISTADLPAGLRLREGFAGGVYEGKIIILGKDIYIEFPWMAHAFKEEKEKNKDFQAENFSWASGWFLGRDGQSVPLPVPDTPGDSLNFDLSIYPKGWDFTRGLEKIEEDLGVEEINGIKCRRYKVKTKKKDLHPLKEGTILEQVENKIRYVTDDKEILFPLPESLSLPVMYKMVKQFGYRNNPDSQYYNLTTWGTEGEICVGESDFRVYKENYTTEEFSIEGYCPSEPEGFMEGVCRYNTEITYSDFNGNIKIEAPVESIAVNDYLKQIGYPITEEEISKAKMETRDERRKLNLRELLLVLDLYYSDYTQYPISINLEKINDENSNFYKALIPNYLSETQVDWYLFDPLDPEFYYTYKSDGRSYELTARLENLEDEDCVMENGICLYKCKDGVCGK